MFRHRNNKLHKCPRVFEAKRDTQTLNRETEKWSTVVVTLWKPSVWFPSLFLIFFPIKNLIVWIISVVLSYETTGFPWKKLCTAGCLCESWCGVGLNLTHATRPTGRTHFLTSPLSPHRSLAKTLSVELNMPRQEKEAGHVCFYCFCFIARHSLAYGMHNNVCFPPA